jgi:predicted amidohydrolase YtcJ
VAWEAIISGNGVTSGFGDDWVKFAGIKIFYDGGMTLKTALMRDVYPDSHDDYHGIAQQTPERLTQLVSICNRLNWRVGVHVVGDLGIDQVLMHLRLPTRRNRSGTGGLSLSTQA